MEIDESYPTTVHSQAQFQIEAKNLRKQTTFDVGAASRQPSISEASQQETYVRLTSAMRSDDCASAQSAAIELARLMREGGQAVNQPYCVEAMKALTIYFNKLAMRLQDQQEEQEEWETACGQNTEYLMLQVLSAISQILNDHSGIRSFVFPFSRSFVMNVFMVSGQLIQASKFRKQITKILSVVLVSLASSQKLIDGLNILPRLKQTVLEIYQFADDVNTFGRMNRALKNIVMLAPLSIAEVRKYRLLETVARFTASKNIAEVLTKLGLHKFINKPIVVDPNLLQGFSRSAFT